MVKKTYRAGAAPKVRLRFLPKEGGWVRYGHAVVNALTVLGIGLNKGDIQPKKSLIGHVVQITRRRGRMGGTSIVIWIPLFLKHVLVLT